MAEAFIVRRSGGASLNYKVVGGTSEPESPKENTIWVNTDVAITSHVFSASQPANPVAGMVWFPTGAVSDVAFNALKKNNITVYPTGCKQYAGGTWVTKETKTFQNGKWVLSWDGMLYKNGNEYPDITGGFIARATRYAATVTGYGITASAPDLSKDESGMTVSLMVIGIRSGSITTVNSINLAPYSKIVFDVNLISRQNGDEKFYVTADPDADPYTAGASVSITATGRQTVSLDISEITTPMYVGINLYASGSAYQLTKMTVYSIRVE